MNWLGTVLCSFALVTVLAFRQVSSAGQICGGNNECGFNEECIINTNLDTPCLKGVCTCVPGYVPDANGNCQRLVQRKLNETCSSALTYEVYPANAICKNGTVVCQPEFSPSSNSCIRPISATGTIGMLAVYNQLTEGSPCQKSSDCMGDMQCGDGARYICVCRAGYMRFDMLKQKCIRREFGDPCQRDSQCNVYAHPWHTWFTNFDGYNYREGRCVGGRCVCSDNGVSTVRISFVDLNTTLSTKTVCIVSGASFVKKGNRCTINPIGYGASTQTAVCEVGSVCYQCPEEYSQDNYGTQIGTCRNVKNQIAYDLQRPSNRLDIDPSAYGPDGNLPPGYDQYGYSITASTSTTKAVTTEPVLRKRVGDICTTNSDCGTNEVCNIATNVDTPCSKGFCTCKPCFAVDAIMNLCYPLVPRTLSDVCYNSDNEVLPKNAQCDRGIVRCKWGYSPSLVGGDCTRQRGVGAFGDQCTSSSQCADGLVCNQDYYMCDCPHVYEMWDNITQRCVNREFGDPCSDENECRVPGGNWSGFTYAGGTCYRGRCACGTYNQKVSVGYVENETGTFKTKTICISEGATLNIVKGGRCTIDPIKYGQQPSTRVCGTTNMCYQCPEDYLQLGPLSTGDGYCRAVSRSPPQPNCDSYLTTTTSSPNFGLK